MLTIKTPFIDEKDGISTLITDVDVNGDVRRITASVENEYAPYLCCERSDAVVIGLLSYALRHKHDIVCEAPVTDELLYNINEVLLPALLTNDSENYNVHITCDTAPCIQKSLRGGRNWIILRSRQFSCGR